jgi:hypothetical protein
LGDVLGRGDLGQVCGAETIHHVPQRPSLSAAGGSRHDELIQGQGGPTEVDLYPGHAAGRNLHGPLDRLESDHDDSDLGRPGLHVADDKSARRVREGAAVRSHQLDLHAHQGSEAVGIPNRALNGPGLLGQSLNRQEGEEQHEEEDGEGKRDAWWTRRWAGAGPVWETARAGVLLHMGVVHLPPPS